MGVRVGRCAAGGPPYPQLPLARPPRGALPGNLAAGHLPQPAEGPLIVGKVGTDLTTEQGAEAAKAVALNIMATLKCESPRTPAPTVPGAAARPPRASAMPILTHPVACFTLPCPWGLAWSLQRSSVTWIR